MNLSTDVVVMPQYVERWGSNAFADSDNRSTLACTWYRGIWTNVFECVRGGLVF